MTRTIETLARVPLFRKVPPEIIRRLDTQCAWRSYGPNDEIIGYQDHGTDVFFVASGTVRVLIQSIPGRAVILRDINVGEFFGEFAAIDGQPRSASIVATTAATIARMPASVFLKTVYHHPEVCELILSTLVSQVRMLANRVNEFSTLNVRHRIYAELLRLSRPSKSDHNVAVISPPPFHAEIASRVSTRREAITRELRTLEQIGLLQKRRGALVLRDVRALVARIRESAGDDGR